MASEELPLTALITGGASGIGLGVTRALLASPSPRYNVLIADLSAAAFPAVLASLGTEAVDVAARVECVQADVTRHEELARAFDKARRRRTGWSGRVDVVCAIAGISQVFTDPEGKDPFLRSARLDEAGQAAPPNLKVIDVNLAGVLNTVHLAIAHFRSQDKGRDGVRGRIVCAGSTASIYPFPNESLYGAAKHGVLGTVRSLAPTLLPEGIHINAIAPSLVETNIGNPEAFAALRRDGLLTPMETIVRAVDALVAPSSPLTGQILECCLSDVLLRVPPVAGSSAEARCLDAMWPTADVDASVGAWRSDASEGASWLVERAISVVSEREGAQEAE
ncbi:hypothetical protein JCM3770_004096 [Rhodotorula araucariae]